MRLKSLSAVLAGSVCAAALLVSCGGPAKYQSSPEAKALLDRAQSAYKARNYGKALEELNGIIARGMATGDAHYYAGYALYALTQPVSGKDARSAEDEKQILERFEAATNWFAKYRSEYPEDQNAQKAYYNLGIVYFDRFKNAHGEGTFDVAPLGEVKKIWDAGLAVDPANPWIKEAYPSLEAHVVASSLERKARSLVKAVNDGDKAQVKTLCDDLAPRLKALNPEDFEKKKAPLSELLTRLVLQAKNDALDPAHLEK